MDNDITIENKCCCLNTSWPWCLWVEY